MAVEIPHLALPLRLVGSRLATVEQDSNDEIAQCVETICRYRQGYRPEAPDFGLPELAFIELPLGTAQIEREVARQEPRANALFEDDPDLYADATAIIRIQVGGGESGD